jgi:DNA-binding NtrC family response regulator
MNQTQVENQHSVLLVDDDRHLLESMGQWLQELGYRVGLAATCQDGRALLAAHKFSLAIIDLRLPDGDGFELLNECQRTKPDMSVILLTGYGTVETAVEALRAGAFDLLTKPLIDQELEMSINRALSQRQVLQENENLKTQLEQKFGLDNIIGSHAHMQRTFEIVDSVASTKATVLITGESGTGKSLIARAIHRQSDRKDGPFVEVACGALPENLLESELFGHVSGAFTGATGAKVGKFKQADKGTIFLDEIGTASPGFQVKLLRVLQELQFEPVGGTKTEKVDTRVILATNENLEQCVAEGRFRQDLFYRINVINIELPPLRNRIADIPMLAEFFLQNIVAETGKQIEGFEPAVINALQSYKWPGNVRELQNVIERAVLLGKGVRLAPQDLPTHISKGASSTSELSGQRSLKEAMEEPERQIILQVLRENEWNRNITADQLGINRTTLYKKMKRLGLENVGH